MKNTRGVPRRIALALIWLSAELAVGQEYRGLWVETFNTPLNSQADVSAVVAGARAANLNALFVQVRRRGDSWYLASLEPTHTALQPGFDPLKDLIERAHAENIEVHAFVIMGALWNRDTVPPDPAHPMALHGFGPDGKVLDGPENWLTRSLLPDGGFLSQGGQRFGNEFWIDFGHPDAAQYSVETVLHLVRNYDIDGLHLDRIRYPEIEGVPVDPAAGASVGYNATAVARYQRRYGLTGVPGAADARWAEWRREQVTNLVRKIYLHVQDAKPGVKVSAALIAFGGAPASDAQWPQAQAYWRVFQDWRAWTEEGILDLAIPMNYKREHVAAQLADYDAWSAWMKDRAYRRAVLVGQGAFVNSIEGTLRQVRRAQSPSPAGKRGQGIVFFSLAGSNAAVPANPLAGNRDSPLRPFADLAAALTAGRSADGTVRFADGGMFAARATPPELSWKAAPRLGHFMGWATNQFAALDGAEVQIAPVAAGSPAIRTSFTDATGFFGAVDLAPGAYCITVKPVREEAFPSSCGWEIAAGRVTTVDLGYARGASPALVSAAGLRGGPLAPGAIATAFGNGLAAAPAQLAALPPPLTLGGVSVMVGDRPAPLYFVSPRQVNFLVPPESPAGSGTARFTSAGAVQTAPIQIARVSPALFTANGTPDGPPAASALRIKSDGARELEPVAKLDFYGLFYEPAPLDLGPAGDRVYLLLYGTGIARRRSLASVVVTVGGRRVPVVYAGPQDEFPGLDQVNVELPRSLIGAGEVQVVVAVDGYVANVTKIAVQ